MHLKVTVPADIMIDSRQAAEAAGRGVSNAVKSHLMSRNFSAQHPSGFPKSNYYGEAANSVTTEINGNVAVVAAEKEGLALHYYGGIVYPGPGKKALAIPKRADAAGKRPTEYDPMREMLALIWPKGESTGTLREKSTGDIVYMLVDHATIKEDKTVLPEESALQEAAMNGIWAQIELWR